MDEDTVEYWKEKYDDLNAQYDEFQKQSFELENELEVQLKHSENQIKDLQNRSNRLSIDNDTLKNKLNDVNISTHKQISNLQEELAKFKAVKEEMQKYIRELEQKNDNLEQTNRCAMFSLGEFEAKMNEALEKNAILQSEMEAKDDLSETVQRLRDETRDLKQELAVRQKANQSLNIKHTMEANAAINSINKMDVSPPSPNGDHLLNKNEIKNEASQPNISNSLTNSAQQQQQTTLNTILNELNLQQQQQQMSHNKTTLINGINDFKNMSSSNVPSVSGMAPSVRISALNFVGDALRKVTSIESRLLNSRSLMKEGNKDRRSNTISTMIDSSNFNHVNANNTPVSKATIIAATTNTTVNVY